MSADLVERVLDLVRKLRSRGLPVTSAHAADALRALSCVGLDSRERVHQALRCVLISRPEDFSLFDELFAQLFAQQEAPLRKHREPDAPAEAVPSLASWNEEEEASETQEIRAASDRPALAEKDFRAFAADELAEIERIAARIARKLAARPSRRWKAARRGRRIDLRATMRRSLSTGEPLDLRHRRRKTRKTRIVALCDVSGSMDLYSRLLLQFLYALQGSFARVESFVFATELRHVTSALRARRYDEALAELRLQAQGWSGGTRIGASLSTFNAEWSRLVDRRTVVIVLSDGWDTGDPQELSLAMEALRMRSRRLIWLNPLLGSEGYQPVAQGMAAALPHVDVFAPAHNLMSLRALERHLLV
ncbi:MAG: VWA domain-containing protein [Deltaproteobacteria bacterium]|nr:MAG: VWA domain-containing protein [Deltaproteobacteria bacterium]